MHDDPFNGMSVKKSTEVLTDGKNIQAGIPEKVKSP